MRHQYKDRFRCCYASGLCLFVLVACLQAAAPTSGAGAVRGAVYTVSSGQERVFVPGAHITIQAAEGDVPAIAVTSDAEGHFSTAALPVGIYQITAASAGLRADARMVQVDAGNVAEVDVELTVEAVKEEITVSAQTEALDTKEAESKAVLQQSTIEQAPNTNERFQSLLPLVPGVVRGPDGLINMKGGKTSQGAMLVNSANVGDPVMGGAGINLPIDVVSSVQVVANPYDPEFGKLTGAIATVDTKVSDFDKVHLDLHNFLPRPRKRDGSFVGIESTTPRMTVTGPLMHGRVAITQSFEYRYVRTPVNSLPPLRRDSDLESFDSYTQVDIRPTERQFASVSLSIYPQKLNYLGLNSFNTQESTPNLHERGYMLGFSDKLVFESGSLLASQVSYKVMDANVWPNSTDPYRLTVETTTGGFFNRQNRNTDRLEWQEVYSSHPHHAWGEHDPKFGINFVHNAYDGVQTFSPVDVLGVSGALEQQINFSPAAKVSVHQQEFSAFVLDRWTINPKLSLDTGLRLDRDSVADNTHVAPRLGFALAPFGARTVIRGGAGLFYNRLNLNIPTFLQLPERTITQYLLDGSIAGVTAYQNKRSGPLENPRSFAWNVEIEHQLRHDLVLRSGYSQRFTDHDYYLEPTQNADSASLVLHNTGKNSYREFQVTARYQLGKQVVNASYVHSSAVGDLNDFNQFYGNVPTAIIRPNERSLLGFDAPNRVLFWGQFTAPWKITISPVYEIHTGFPYSIVNDERDYIGPRNRTGRFPMFSSLDLQMIKAVAIPMHGKKLHTQMGCAFFNILNHYNPRDIQNDIASPQYGVFLNSAGRMLRGKFTIEF